MPAPAHITWRQIWRVTGRESSSPKLLESPRTSPEVPRTSPEAFGDFPGSSLTAELNSNPEVPRKLPRRPRKFPGLPRKFPGLPQRSAVSLGSLTPSSDSHKLSLNYPLAQPCDDRHFFFEQETVTPVMQHTPTKHLARGRSLVNCW